MYQRLLVFLATLVISSACTQVVLKASDSPRGGRLILDFLARPLEALPISPRLARSDTRGSNIRIQPVRTETRRVIPNRPVVELYTTDLARNVENNLYADTTSLTLNGNNTPLSVQELELVNQAFPRLISLELRNIAYDDALIQKLSRSFEQVKSLTLHNINDRQFEILSQGPMAGRLITLSLLGTTTNNAPLLQTVNAADMLNRFSSLQSLIILGHQLKKQGLAALVTSKLPSKLFKLVLWGTCIPSLSQIQTHFPSVFKNIVELEIVDAEE